jgi:ABC-type transporter Mla MlaB component
MLRVSKAEEPSSTVVTVDGQLSGDSIAVVETCCDQAISTGKAVHLFLRDVSTVDQAGRALLCRLAARGVRLLATGIYTSYLVRTLNPGGMGPLNPGASLR